MKTLIDIAKEKGAFILKKGTVLAATLKANATVILMEEKNLQAAHDDYCKQFEPIYQVRIKIKNDWSDVNKVDYDQFNHGYKRIVYLAPQQIPSEVKAYIERLESLFEAADLTTPFMQNMLKNALASKPAILKD